ncbi:MAG TPA: hypothetical protein EYQ69_02070 [Gemmatimonadetes bacterium]|nr:hypothetical protein [Gemmatimonadota bacterium]
MILGLDVSTTTIGWSVLKIDGTFVSCGFIPLSKQPSLVLKAKLASTEFCEIFLKYPIEHIFIEACLQRFARGMSSAATITKLASFNGIIQYVSYEDFRIEPCLLNVNQARKSVGLKTRPAKKCGIQTKDQVFNWVITQIDFDWPTRVLKSGPRKGLIINLPECFDMADAYVVAKAGHCTLH